MDYGKQANQKSLQAGAKHPGRNAQFEFINAKAGEFISLGKPATSVDTKKKELIGNFKNKGRSMAVKGTLAKSWTMTFQSKNSERSPQMGFST